MTIKVMIVDDSVFTRVLLKDILEGSREKNIQVVASVSCGMDAIKELEVNKDIDIITLDVMMPEMDGIETLRRLMKIRKVPVLMISSLTKNGARETIEALSLGALDFITKMNDEEVNSLYDTKEEIREKVIALAQSNVNGYELIEQKKKEVLNEEINHIVAIGSSTGGPSALRILLSDIPKSFHSPIIIAQHMPEGGFMASLVEKLKQVTQYEVKLIESGETIRKDVIYLCPGGFSVEVFKRGIKSHLILTKKTEINSQYRPSIDMLFYSVARLDKKIRKTGVILTGMGEDGKLGCLAISSNGGKIIAESEKTAVVYGMPKKVAELDIPKNIADIDKIFKYIALE